MVITRRGFLLGALRAGAAVAIAPLVRVLPDLPIVSERRFETGVADTYMDSVYLDLSVAANRRRFISAAGRPVDLGA